LQHFASRVGFYKDREINTVIKTDLLKIAEVTMKDGSIGEVHKFIGTAFCWQGTASSSTQATYSFKPFVEFNGQNGEVFRNWDTSTENYNLGRVNGNWVKSFDRSSELLK
jgi:hypothetical protein